MNSLAVLRWRPALAGVLGAETVGWQVGSKAGGEDSVETDGLKRNGGNELVELMALVWEREKVSALQGVVLLRDGVDGSSTEGKHASGYLAGKENQSWARVWSNSAAIVSLS